ncbi:M56 family metallopeptidase [Leekyejoonella antrihumi]|uniref:M56 family metallopeptidase n=1 Tax=Leekyejoonella antrihumi TaxID=1660198 RepID=A0A563E7W1_9MICO|nr:M56 family metallopeptidase [Leekyejoonella antrihumi]TWP37914.1 M56 family metallopeptidase [Leekyejoonella antrihumi]
MYLAALALVAVVLAWPVPRWLPAVHRLRKVPGSALLFWQAVSLAAVIAGLALAPLAILATVRRGHAVPSPADNLGMLALGLAISAVLAGRLLVQGHLIGTSLRRARREHRELVDLLARATPDRGTGGGGVVRVLAHPTPTAYCVPGASHRVVLSDSTIDALSADELRAVLAHEWAHLTLRHDLVLEFFTVLHTAVPGWVRSARGLVEVRLLIELLADRAAVRSVGQVPVARALVALAEGDHPDAALGYEGRTALIRLEILRDTGRHRALVLVAAIGSLVVLALPMVLGALVIFAG